MPTATATSTSWPGSRSSGWATATRRCTAAAHAQLDRLWHASNLYWTEPMLELAERLSARFGGAQAFFCNSGAEAIEAGLKYARKASGKPASSPSRTRSTAARSARSRSRASRRSSAGFGPLLPDVRFARLNDAESLAAACADGEVGCILVEPIQGEGGINPATASVPRVGRRAGGRSRGDCSSSTRCSAVVGRTGTFFAHEQLGVRPDAVALAKGLANGLPIGALLVADDAAARLLARRPRLDVRRQPGGLRGRLRRGGHDRRRAARAGSRDRCAARRRALGTARRSASVRGAGLMLGAELDRPAGPVVSGMPRERPPRRLGGRSRPSADAAARSSPKGRSTQALADPRRGARDEPARASGNDPAGSSASETSRPRPSSPRRCTIRASTSSRRPSRATSPSSGLAEGPLDERPARLRAARASRTATASARSCSRCDAGR